MENVARPFSDYHFVLHALLKKRAGADAADFSRAEAVLLAHANFGRRWQRRNLRCISLRSRCRDCSSHSKRFSEIGAVRVASALRVALGDRPEVRSSTWLRQQALDLEGTPLNTEDAVDHLIAPICLGTYGAGFVGEGVRSEYPESPQA